MLDFGGQYSQLIARRVRECGVFAELLPHHVPVEDVERRRPKALILSGGPASVYAEGAPEAAHRAARARASPCSGICYGMQAMVLELGGRVEGAEVGEFGRSHLTVASHGRLLADTPDEQSCWMSHRDTVFEAPAGFAALASSTESPVAAIEDTERGLYGIQFHPEVVHTPYGTTILETFLRDIAGCDMSWSAASVIEEQVARIREQVGDGKVICGLSGGVDSSVAALLTYKAVGEQLTCVFVDHGLMRKNEGNQVVAAFRDQFKVPLIAVDAEARFLDRLAGVTEPERKRKIIGEEFIRVFERAGGEARQPALPRAGHALLGRDRVGRRHRRGHDQVAPQRGRPAGGPRVRAGRAAADALQGRGSPGGRGARDVRPARVAPALPGPGPRDPGGERRGRPRSASRSCATPTRSSRTRSAPRGMYRELWQSFCVLPADLRSVGVQGDERTYGYVVVIRAVTSDDAMTADWARLPYDLLEKVASRMINEIQQVNRVTLDITSKPPGTIEWE